MKGASDSIVARKTLSVAESGAVHEQLPTVRCCVSPAQTLRLLSVFDGESVCTPPVHNGGKRRFLAARPDAGCS